MPLRPAIEAAVRKADHPRATVFSDWATAPATVSDADMPRAGRMECELRPGMSPARWPDMHADAARGASRRLAVDRFRRNLRPLPTTLRACERMPQVPCRIYWRR